MVKNVTEESYFHINSDANRSTYPIMRRGDIIEIGNNTNPFFRFYEIHKRTYPVTNTATDTIQEVPAIKLLRCVRDGAVTSDILPTIAFETANHFLMLARELVWENVRLAEFPDTPSRQRCIWLIQTLDDVKQWVKRIGFKPNHFSVVKVRATGRAITVDGTLLADDSEPLAVWYEKARAYWSGKSSENPLPEILFDGTLQVEEIVNINEF